MSQKLSEEYTDTAFVNFFVSVLLVGISGRTLFNLVHYAYSTSQVQFYLKLVAALFLMLFTYLFDFVVLIRYINWPEELVISKGGVEGLGT